jgi:hypothetical protein
LAGKQEGKKPLGRSKRRWEDTIKMYLREIEIRVWTGFVCLGIVTVSGLL